MSSISKLARYTVVPVAAVAALGLASPAAFAASSYNVTAGSAAAGTSVPLTGKSGAVTFTDVTSNTTVNCSSSSMGGTTKVGDGLGGDGIAALDGSSASFSSCVGPLGTAFTITGTGTWNLNATGDTANGSTAGNISGISTHVSGSGCSFDAAGAVDGSYTNGASSGTLAMPGTDATLTLSNVSGFLCGSVGVADGDKVSFKASYAVTANDAANNPVAVSSNA